MDLKEIGANNKLNINRHPWELARVEIIINLIKQSKIDLAETNISIIDIGCGDLYVLEKINAYFKFDELYGIDIALSNERINQLNTKYTSEKIRVYNDLNQLKTNNKNTTIILLNDVLEHIEDDKNFLLDLKNKEFVNENTIFIITVPAFQILFCSHDVFLDHYRRYNKTQLVTLLNNTGFKTTTEGYFFFALLLPRFLFVLKEKLIKKQPNINDGTNLTNWDGSKFISMVLKNILLMDYYLTGILNKIRIKIPGLSTYAICKKSV